MTRSQEEIVEEMQLIVAQMKIDDLEDNPDSELETFQCDCCSQAKPKAGAVLYGAYNLCNDCVLYAETGFALKKIEKIEDLIATYEDKRLESLCEFIEIDQKSQNN